MEVEAEVGKSSSDQGKGNASLRCMSTNVRSIMNKETKEELICRLKEDNIDVLGITESWAHEEINDAELNLEGYRVFRRDRVKGKGKSAEEVESYYMSKEILLPMK